MTNKQKLREAADLFKEELEMYSNLRKTDNDLFLTTLLERMDTVIRGLNECSL